MDKIKTVVATISGRGLPLQGNDIDTDRIIPARFLRCVTFDALGEQVFFDERYTEDGTMKSHPFNDTRFAGAEILFVNNNFGCGSSREHAPQALMRFGIKAVVGESFAEIFAGNCLSLGIPVLTGSAEKIERIQQKARASATTEYRVDIAEKTIMFSGETIGLEMVEAARTALLSGTWDSLDLLRQNDELIEEVYRKLPYT